MAIIARVLFFLAGLLCIPLLFVGIWFFYRGPISDTLLPAIGFIFIMGLTCAIGVAVLLWEKSKAFTWGLVFFLLAMLWNAVNVFLLKAPPEEPVPVGQIKIPVTYSHEK